MVQHPSKQSNQSLTPTVSQIVAALQQLLINGDGNGAPYVIQIVPWAQAASPTPQAQAASPTPTSPAPLTTAQTQAQGLLANYIQGYFQALSQWTTLSDHPRPTPPIGPCPGITPTPSDGTAFIELTSEEARAAQPEIHPPMCCNCYAGAAATAAIPSNPASNATASTDAWYTVTVGRSVGVYRGWHNVAPLVNGVSKFCVKRYSSWDAAIEAFAEAEAAGYVHRTHFLKWAQSGLQLRHQQYTQVITPLERRILFMTEEERYQAMVDDLENVLFHGGRGEFTDVAMALRNEQRKLGLFP
ncbi:hypothetical protein C0992_003822 [Termitomyces sp. T32_za158]|nr:hypothetical protein C0992_003822 [Termitomyces sp. T32_za158]